MKLARIKFALMERSPEILVAAGIVGTVVSAVMACRATLQIDDILAEHNANVKKIHEGVENAELEAYTEKEGKRDLAVAYAKTGLRFVRAYAPAVAVGAFSIGAIIASNDILRRRNIALAAAYTAIDETFKKYRGRVVEKFGEALDKEMATGIRQVEVKKTIEDEDGKKKKVKEEVRVLDREDSISEYGRIFDENNKNWEANDAFSRCFLERQQSYANDRLRSQGFLFLNEVYKLLGFDPTPEGQVVGWWYDPDSEDPKGDNYVDFNIQEVYPAYRLVPDEPAPDLDIPWEEDQDPVFVLDFNVDGYILDRM